MAPGRSVSGYAPVNRRRLRGAHVDGCGRGHRVGGGAARPYIRDKTLSRAQTRMAGLSRGLIGAFKERKHLTPQPAIDKGFGFFSVSVRASVCNWRNDNQWKQKGQGRKWERCKK